MPEYDFNKVALHDLAIKSQRCSLILHVYVIDRLQINLQ